MAYKKSYTKIIVAGQTDVAPSEHTDELTLAAGSNITLTTSDDTVTIAASGGGGGSSSSKYVMRLAGRFSVTSSSALMLHGSAMNNAMGGDFNLGRTDIGSLSNTSFTVTNRQAAYYYTMGICPSDCTLDEVVVYSQLRYTYTNAPEFRVWRGTFTANTAGDVTWTQVFAAEPIGTSTSTADVGCIATKSLTTGNTFNAGDLVGFSFQSGGSTNSNLNQFTATLLFTES